MSADRPVDVSYELGGIKQALETITRTLSENRMADAQYRTGIREEMTKQRDAIGHVGSDLAIAKKDIADTKEDISGIRPKLQSLEDRALMSKGAANFAILLGKFAHVVSAGIGGVIVLLIDRLIFHKP
jgi:hypothetical protein